MSNKIALSKQLQTLNQVPIQNRRGMFDDSLNNVNNNNQFKNIIEFINQQDVNEMINGLILTQNLGKIFTEELQDLDENQNTINIKVINFIKLGSNSAIFTINQFENGIQILEEENDEKKLIGTNLSDFIICIFERHFGKDYQDELQIFINERYGQNFNIIDNQFITKTPSKPYQKDNIYHFLIKLTNRKPTDFPQFYLEKIGKIQQNQERDKWIVFGKDKEFNLNDVDELIKYLSDKICENKPEMIEKVNNHLIKIQELVQIENNNNTNDLEEQTINEIDYVDINKTSINLSNDYEEEWMLNMIENLPSNDKDDNDFSMMLSEDEWQRIMDNAPDMHEMYFDEENMNFDSLPSITESELEDQIADYYAHLNNLNLEMNESQGYNNDFQINENSLDFFEANIMKYEWQELNNFNYPFEVYFKKLMESNELVKPKDFILHENKVEFVFQSKNNDTTSIFIIDNQIYFNDETKNTDFNVFYPKLFVTFGSNGEVAEKIRNNVNQYIEQETSNLNDETRLFFAKKELENRNPFDEQTLEQIVANGYSLFPFNKKEENKGKPTYIIEENNKFSQFRFQNNRWITLGDTQSIKDSKEEFLDAILKISNEKQLTFDRANFVNNFNSLILKNELKNLLNSKNYLPEFINQNNMANIEMQQHNENMTSQNIIENHNTENQFENVVENINVNVNVNELGLSSEQDLDTNDLIQEQVAELPDFNEIESQDNTNVNDIQTEVETEIVYNKVNEFDNQDNTTSVNQIGVNDFENNHLESKVVNNQEKDEFEDNLNELFNKTKARYLENKRVSDKFSLKTFLELCITNENFAVYKVVKQGDNYLFGNKKKEIDLNNFENMTASQFFKQMTDELQNEGINVDLKDLLLKLDNKLEPEFDQRIKEKILQDMQNHLFDLKIKQEQKHVQQIESNKTDYQYKNHNIETEQTQNTNSVKKNSSVNVKSNAANSDNSNTETIDLEELEGEEKWKAMFFQDRKYQGQKLRQYLYEYELPSMLNNRISVNIQSFLRELISYQNYVNNRDYPDRFNDIRLPEITTDYIKNGNFNVTTIKLNEMFIKITSGQNSEKWETNKDIVINNQKVNGGDSIIELFNQYLFKQMGLSISSNTFHAKIGIVLERQFYNNYPAKDLLLAYSHNVKPNNTGGEVGNITWSENPHGGGIMFWNGQHNSLFNSLVIATHIAMQNDPTIGDTWKNHIGNKITVFNNLPNSENYIKEAKEIIKAHFLNLNSLQRKNFLISKHGNQNKDSGYDDYFEALTPKPTKEGTEKARQYLIENRYLNPAIVYEYEGKGWYGGNYDYTYRARFSPENISSDSFVNVVAFPNPIGSFIAVRGTSKDGPASMVKENVPGGHDHGQPIVIDKSNLFEFKDKDNPLSKKTTVVFCEAAIDGYSYKSLYPNAIIFAMSSANTSILTRSLEEVYDFISEKEIEKGNIEYIYALDNIQLDEHGVELDSTSRANYFKIMSHMGKYCWNQFYSAEENNKKINDFIDGNSENDNDGVAEHFLNLIRNSEKKYSQRQINFAEETLNKYQQEHNSMDYNLVSFQQIVGKIIFQFDYIDKGIFKLAIPEHPELKQVKDWNEYLKELYLLRKEQNPTLDCQEIHNMITFEHSPELKMKDKVLENTKKRKLNM